MDPAVFKDGVFDKGVLEWIKPGGRATNVTNAIPLSVQQ